MTHGVTIHNSRVEMAYTGEDTPWHGLGNNLAIGATIEEWAVAAGLDWQVHSAVAQFLYNNELRSYDDRKVLHRSDTGLPLGVVSNKYLPVNPTEILEFFRGLTDAAGFTLETAGTLFGGKRIWAMASIGEEAAVADPRDKMKGRLLLSTACDGSMATEGRFTTIRVVCNNTLGFARDATSAAVKVSHRTKFDPDQVKREMGVESAHSGFHAAMAEFRSMAESPMSPIQVIESTARLFHPGFDDLSKADKLKLIDKPSGPVGKVGMLALDHRARGSEFSGTQGTAWGWLNAVTEYVDHDARSHSQDNRINSAWFGRGAEIKEAARVVAMEMVAADGTIRTVHQVVNSPASGDAPSVSLDDVLALTAAC